MLARILIFIGWIVIAASAHAQVVVFEENFDGPGAGWVLESGWALSTSTPSSGSGMNSLEHRGNAAAGAFTPSVHLGGATAATLSYLVRRTASYDLQNLVVKGSYDGGATFPITILGAGSAVPAADGKWERISATVPDELLGSSDVVIRFEGMGHNTAAATARIDDVSISAAVPLEVIPRSLTFIAPVGGSETKLLTVTNRTSSPMTVGAPVLTGAGFSIDPSDGVELPSGAAAVYALTFTASSQGTIDGAVRLDYGFGTADVVLAGTGSGGLLSFTAASSPAFEDESEVSVPLRLAFSASAGLQGLQFRMAWTGDAFVVTGVERGSAIASESDWTLSHEVGSGYVDVLLLGDGTASLDAGTYEGLLSLLFDVATVRSGSTATLTIESVIGALAEPGGSDADLSPSSQAHVLTIVSAVAYFSASASSLDLGPTTVGETATTTMTVSNPGGTADLVIGPIHSSNPRFSITPATVQVAPDASRTFTITFMPTTTSFGRQTGVITFMHNAEGGSDVISVTGKGRGGRGDAEGDGMVDAMDVVHAIDYVLNRLTPDASQRSAADLFPFPVGDGELDVRDLTVLSQAIVRGRWPDDVDLPAEEVGAGKSSVGGIRLATNPGTIELVHDSPIRAFQVVVPASRDARVDVETTHVNTEYASNGAVEGGPDPTIAFGLYTTPSDPRDVVDEGSTSDRHELRVLVYHVDGALIPPGVIRLAAHGLTGVPRYVTVIGEGRERLRVDASVWTGTEDARPNVVLPEKPFPNPLRAVDGVLRIPIGAGARRVVVFDLLGRVVRHVDVTGEEAEWDGLDGAGRRVGSGTYFVRIDAGHAVKVYPIHVVH